MAIQPFMGLLPQRRGWSRSCSVAGTASRRAVVNDLLAIENWDRIQTAFCWRASQHSRKCFAGLFTTLFARPGEH